jgi:hypothetical protein
VVSTVSFLPVVEHAQVSPDTSPTPSLGNEKLHVEGCVALVAVASEHCERSAATDAADWSAGSVAESKHIATSAALVL